MIRPTHSRHWDARFTIWSNPAHLQANAAARLVGFQRAQRRAMMVLAAIVLSWAILLTGALLIFWP